jgi:hypothetical protein
MKIEEIDDFLIGVMQKKCLDSVQQFEKYDYNRKKKIKEFDIELKEKFNPKKFESNYVSR